MRKITKVSWTTEEDNILIQEMRNNPPVDITAQVWVRNVINLLPKKRSFSAVSCRLYKKLGFKGIAPKRKGRPRTFNDEKENYIHEFISEHSENLQSAFEQLGKELGVSKRTLGLYWYRRLKYQKPSFSLSSKTGGYANCKNVRKGTEEKHEKLKIEVQRISPKSYVVYYPSFYFTTQTSTL